MTQAEFDQLREGDLVISICDGLAYIVTLDYGDRKIAVRTVELTNPDEWQLVHKGV